MFDKFVKIIQLPFNLLRFKRFHYTAKIKRALLITPKYVSVGKNVFIWNNARIEGVVERSNRNFTPEIIFEDNVSIQQNLHLTCATRVCIGKNTAVAANVTITDINHAYEDVMLPIEQQRIETKPVAIGEDCKIYNNAVILPGTNIGKHCVIGANAVVTRDIPDYSVAVGVPARVIKQYNFETEQWETK